MPLIQSGTSFTANIGIYNDFASNQVNTQGDVNVQHNNYIKKDPNGHKALIHELKDRLNPSELTGDDRPECLKNTRRETLQSIYRWADARGYPNVLLLIGAAGTGKSTIATTVAGMYQRKGRLGCHISFLQRRSHPGDALQTIAYSLAVYNQSIAKYLVGKLRNGGDIGPSSLKTKFEILLRDPLSVISTKVRDPVLIVLDAFDECGTPELRQSLLNVLQDRLSTLPANFRILITSRPDEDIVSLKFSPSFLTITLDQHSDESEADVSTYIKLEFNRMRSSGKLNVPDDCEWDDDLRRLTKRADGLFIWASTAVRFVREVEQFRYRCFQNLVSNASSLKLDELYMTVLSHVSEWNEEDKEILRNIFSLILFARRPLSDIEISEILDVEMDVTSNLLSYFRSLVRYERGNPITIQHASFYDYLTSCQGMPWYIDPEVQKAYIASKCFERMGDFLKYNICNIPSDFVLNADVPDIDNRVTTCIPPFLKYICCNWIHHLQDVSYSRELCFQLRSFVYNQLLFWFEVLSLTNTFNDHAGPTLLFATQWLGNNDPELSSFLRDAYRQASTYSEPISQSVSQIYTSLLPLTKEDSPVSIHYAKYANSALRVEYIGKKQRNDCIKTIQVNRRHALTYLLLFSYDCTQILSDSKQGVCVWDATSGELTAGPLVAEDDEDNALSAAYLPDGKYSIIASRNGVIRKWDLLTNYLVWERELSDFQMDTRWCVSAAFSPDRKSVVFGDDRGRIRVWNVDTGEQDVKWLEGHSNRVNCLSFSPDSKYLVSGSYDTTIVIWDMDKRKARIGPLRRHIKEVTAVEFSPCGTNVVSGSADRTILVWDVFTGEVLREITCKGGVKSVTYSPNGLFILAGGEWWMSMWNVVDFTAAPKVFQTDGNIQRLSFSPDGSRFMFGGAGRYSSLDDGLIEIWDASWDAEEARAAFEEQQQITSISLSPSGKFIASGSREGSVYLWNILTGELSKKLYLGSGIDSVAFSPINEGLIAFGSNDRTVRVWDVANDEPVTLGIHKGWVSSVAFSPSDGIHVASGSWDKTIRIWNSKQRKLAIGPLKGHTDHVLALSYSPDGKRLVSGSYDNTVRIWNSLTGRLLSTLIGHSSFVYSVAYSFDGSRIVSGSRDKTILVWDAQSGQIVCGPITGHDKWVRSVCFSPDGKRILSGSWDNTARVCDAITGRTFFPPFSGHTLSVESVCFFPDGRHFATGSFDGTIRIWTLDTILDGTNWELRDDNWVVGENGKLMMWIPKNLHTHLYSPRIVSILSSSFRFKLHFDAE